MNEEGMGRRGTVNELRHLSVQLLYSAYHVHLSHRGCAIYLAVIMHLSDTVIGQWDLKGEG